MKEDKIFHKWTVYETDLLDLNPTKKRNLIIQRFFQYKRKPLHMLVFALRKHFASPKLPLATSFISKTLGEKPYFKIMRLYL